MRTEVVNAVLLYSVRLVNSAHVDFVHGLSWHPTEPYLVTCSWDGQVLHHSVDISSSKGISLLLELMYEKNVQHCRMSEQCRQNRIAWVDWVANVH